MSMWTVPNILTLFRIVLIPIFVVCFYLPVAQSSVIAAVIFAAAAITDWLDGFLARQLDQSSKLGAFLDPVADKLMVAVVLVVLLQNRPEIWMALPVAVILGREITVSALREWMAEIGARRKVAVSWLGKIKTTLQMLALILLILASDSDLAIWFDVAGISMLYAAAAITLWSMVDYLRLAWPDLKDS